MKVILSNTLSKKGLSQYWLSKHSGISASTINNLYNNKTNRIEFDTLQKICDVLECEITDVLKLD